MKVLVITQARIGSTRLPNKVLKTINGKTLLQIHIERISRAKRVDCIYIATTTEKGDGKIVEHARELGVQYYQGSENDVLDRFYQCAKIEKPEYVVRLTSDCPLIDPVLLDEVIEKAIEKDLDYYANIIEERYPDGQDIEVIKFSALEKAWQEASSKSDREHVTPYVRNNSSYKGGKLFCSDNHFIEKNYNHVRLTVDEPADFEVISLLVEQLGTGANWLTYANFYLQNEAIRRLNGSIQRNEGYQRSIDKETNK